MSLALNLGILDVLLDVKFVLIIDHELGVTLDILHVRFQIEDLVLLAGVLLFQLLHSLHQLLVVKGEFA